MCSSFAIFLFVPVFLLGDASSAISSSTEVVSRFQEEALHLDCPSCSLPHIRKNSSSFEGQTEMVEAVKRHILNMLHLNARPNLTQPVPRAALFNVIKKLHFGHIAEDGSVEIQDKIQGPREPTLHEPPSEIITFGEAGDSPDKVVFNLVTEGGGSVVVEQANVWIFLMKSKVVRMKRKVMLRLLQPNQSEEGETAEECISEKMVDTQRSGWHMLAVPQTVQQLLSSGGSLLRLQISCPLCGEVGVSPILTSARGGHPTERDQSHRPFLMVMLRVGGETSQQRVKRGLECDARIHVCCKRQFYINFKDIGWSDWIIAPSGYHANYCEGDCPNHMSNIGSLSHSFHSAVINHYRMRGYSPFQNMKSCCVPTRLQAMSMLYYNEEQKIIKKDIQNMIVEECGCS